ncbi:hypothetical protein [Leptospira dzoumogneensis]|nr:hypothetical protein [Leptospira dzoumogneensis]
MKRKILIFLLACATFQSCYYSTEKRYTVAQPFEPNDQMYFDEENPQFEEGKPYSVLDFIGSWIWIDSLFSKVMIWDRRMQNHKFSFETKKYLMDYIRDNNLKDVKVRFNQYAPISDFKRLWDSKSVNPILKWTIGLYAYVVYDVLFIGRIFGGDHYNPYSNTIHVYSDIPAVVIHEGGHSKDFAQREYRSLYALGYAVPIVGAFYPEARASDDAIRYFRYLCDKTEEMTAYRTLYPAYGSYVGGGVSKLLPSSPYLALYTYSIIAAAASTGHVVGYVRQKQAEKEWVPKECMIAAELEKKK